MAHTGVVGYLRGARERPLLAMRADMDALPVAEEVDQPFASRATAKFRGEDVGVMHACGHDAHTAILMAAASVLAARKDSLQGSVMYLKTFLEKESSIEFFNRSGDQRTRRFARHQEANLLEE